MLLSVGFLVFCIIFDAALISIPLGVWRDWLLWYLNCLANSINVLQFSSYVESLYHPFNKFNADVRKSWIACHLHSRTIPNQELKFYTRTYERLCDTVKLMNNCFGVQILFFTVTVQVALIRVAYVPLKLYLQGSQGPLLRNITLSSMGYAGSFLVFAWLLVRYCNRTTAEVKKLYQISHDILLSLPSLPERHQEKALKEQIMLLGERANEKSVCFSTVMFTIDNSLLLIIFNCVTTYLIILLQY
nr:unnamed protein product [Callosobruchus chinensis]